MVLDFVKEAFDNIQKNEMLGECECCGKSIEGRPLVYRDRNGVLKAICCSCMLKIERSYNV